MRRVGVMLSRRSFAIPFGRTRQPYLSCRMFASQNPSVGSSRLLDHHSRHCNMLSEKQESPNEQKTCTLIRPYALFSYRGPVPLNMPPRCVILTNHIMTYRKPDVGLLTRPTIFQAQIIRNLTTPYIQRAELLYISSLQRPTILLVT